MKVHELAYAAGLIDALGNLRTRRAGETELPSVTIQGRWMEAIKWLGEITGSKITHVEKEYYRHNCTDHCPSAHQQILSSSARWQVTGARATIVLYNVLPYMLLQRERASELIEAGTQVGWKSQAVQPMIDRGWELPVMKSQSRARLVVAK